MAVKKYRAKKIISKLLFGILVLVIVIPILFPLYFVLISSFKNMAQVYIMPPKLFGFKPILDNYIYIFKTQHYGTYMMNSTIVAVASTALSLLLGVPAAYAIARYKMGKANTAIGTEMHEAPEIPNFAQRRKGIRLAAGMTLAIEPMITAGRYDVVWEDDGWTVVTEDGSLASHYENTILITDGEPEILSL